MKVCMLGPKFFPSRIGGAETQVFEMSKRLADRGHKVYVFTAEKGEFKHENIEVVEVPHIHAEFSDMSLTYLTYCIFSFFFALKYALKAKFDIIHTNSHPSGIIGVLLKIMTGKPMVYTLQGTGPDNIRARGKLVGYFISLLDFLTLKFSDYLISTTKYNLETLKKFYGLALPNSGVIPNGLDIERFSSGNAAKVKREFGLKDEQIVIYVGRLVEVKGLNYLLKGFAGVAAQIKNVKLFLVGDGPLKSVLQNHAKSLGIQDRVVFTGTRRNIPDLLAASDVLVLTSLHEGMPNVVLEAMAAGKPVIATDIMGNSETVREGKTGILIKQKSELGLENALVHLLKNRSLMEKFGSNAKKYVKQYSYDSLIEKIIKVYEFVCRKRQERRL